MKRTFTNFDPVSLVFTVKIERTGLREFFDLDPTSG